MAKTKYRHFCFKDRIILQSALDDGAESIVYIAAMMNKSTQTIRNEINNSGMTKESYRAIDAQLNAV